jgi:hypothetical protein
MCWVCLGAPSGAHAAGVCVCPLQPPPAQHVLSRAPHAALLARASQQRAPCPQVALPSGVRYTDLRKGGGQAPIKGYLVLVDYE